ncbi:MAG: prephenate dehydrogenase/arogenate dehydrogenase family protein [Chloroflexota bacterium]
MANLKVALLGMNRTTASVGLALKRYMKKGGKNTFTVSAYDYSQDNLKNAKKMDAVDETAGRPQNAVDEADIVVMAVSYEETEVVYQEIKPYVRDGVVILDMSPLKRPSLEWSSELLSDSHHVIGMTPILNPRYIFSTEGTVENAEEDMFDDSAILLTPAAGTAKEAVDLAFTFSSLIGSKPRFLDPLEHDMLLAQTVQLPRVLGTVLFYHTAKQPNWEDLKWLTNPDFGALTRPLFDIHPDALRDEFFRNRDAVARNLDAYIDTLTQFRDALREDDKATVESVTVEASETYEQWINARYRADWDAVQKTSEADAGNSFLTAMLGGAIADRLTGKDKDDD